MGLGLAIVKAIAEAHGGSVKVESVVGQGSRFEILLPEALSAVSYGLAVAAAEAEAEPASEGEAAGVGVTDGVAPTAGGESKPNQ